MKKRTTGRIWWWISFLLIAVAAGLIGYYLGFERGYQEKGGVVSKPITPKEKQLPKVETPAPPEETSALKEEIIGTKTRVEEDYCARISKTVLEFFQYLDKKDYIQHLELGTGTYDQFKLLLKKLSAKPPIPAGEGIDPNIMIGNIYHFFRILSKNDLRLIKEVMVNEADTLELNLDFFYKWLMVEEQCPDTEGIRPSLENLYQYAGFLLNTVGGRSYLFRRPSRLRLLLSYYCLLIIHEADKRGMNSYGIDIFPEITPVMKEINIYPDFHFRNEYIHQLTRLQNYYIKKR
ncbi:MAG: hypothetical protein ABII26_09530 [Pseudomonadota bacterium]